MKAKPTSPGRRHVVQVVNHDLHKGAPHAPLLEKNSKSGGRNNNGRITVRHIGGGHKQHYRIIDFKRQQRWYPCAQLNVLNMIQTVSQHCLVLYADGERRYILRQKAAMQVMQSSQVLMHQSKLVTAMPMRNIPVGTTVHAIEMKPGKGAQIARSAGAYAQILCA